LIFTDCALLTLGGFGTPSFTVVEIIIDVGGLLSARRPILGAMR
jgi:hypothetical protein